MESQTDLNDYVITALKSLKERLERNEYTAKKIDWRLRDDGDTVFYLRYKGE